MLHLNVSMIINLNGLREVEVGTTGGSPLVVPRSACRWGEPGAGWKKEPRKRKDNNKPPWGHTGGG